MTTKKTAKKTPTKKRTKKKRTAKKVATRKGEPTSKAAQRFVQMNQTWPWPLRPYQQDVQDAFERGIRRFLLPWHRRAGKDIHGMSMARQQMKERVGSYVHFFPKHAHARRALWRGVDPRKGARFVDIAFNDIEADRNNQDMVIEAYNGSTWSLLGSDNYDSSVIGGNVVGVVFSEWALCDPRAWDYIRPILRENNGWAMFISTFRGRNHMWQMYEKLKDNSDWYVKLLTIEDTRDLEGNRIITDADVQADRLEGMKETLIQQEYYCNPEATADGAIYGRQTVRLREDKSRHQAQWNPSKPVYCIWNLDLPVHASYILAQPGNPPLILEANSEEFTTLAEALARAEQHRFPIMAHIVHDSQREYINGFNDLDRAPQALGNTNMVLEQSATNSLLERCHITPEKCDVLLDSLGGYVRRERFDAQTADLTFSEFTVDSWHERLVAALETWAAWEYHQGTGGWQSQPNYSQMDRLARTVR